MARRKQNKAIAEIRPYPVARSDEFVWAYRLDERVSVKVIQPLVGELGWSRGPVLSVDGRRSGWHLEVNGGKMARLTDSDQNWLEIDGKAAKRLIAKAEERKQGSTKRFTGPCYEEQMITQMGEDWYRTLWAAGHPPKVTLLSHASNGQLLDWEAKEEEINGVMLIMADSPGEPVFQCERCFRWCHSKLEGNADHHRDLCDPCHKELCTCPGLCTCPEVWITSL